MFKPFSYLNSRAFIVLTAVISLLIWWSPPVDGSAEPAATVEPPGVTSETSGDKEEESAEVSVPAPLSFAGKMVNVPSDDTRMWVERFKELAAGIQKETLAPEDADKFYKELNTALKEKRNDLRNALAVSASTTSSRDEVSDEKAPSESSTKAAKKQKSQEADQSGQESEIRISNLGKAELLHAEMIVLYYLRNQVLGIVSSGFRSRITGTGIDGIQALKEELDFIFLKFRFRLFDAHAMGRRVVNSILSAPVAILMMIFQLIIASIAFIWWRRWAFEGIPHIRSRILDISPRKLIHTWGANCLWYLDHVRSPLEWGLLLSIMINIIDVSEGQVIQSLLWTKIKWILTAWFAVALVGAMSARRARGVRSNPARIRMRSIWLLAIWMLVIALGLSITGDLAGKGTAYEWVRIFSKLLAIPVLILIFLWWRPEIYRKLEDESQPPIYIQKILKYQLGLRSYFGAAIGAAYLIVHNFRQWVLRAITAFEGGRALIANLTRLEAMRVSERQRQKTQGDPISEEMRHQLYSENDNFVESVGESTLERMVQLVGQERRGATVLVAERGGGKSQLLKRLDNRIEDKAVLFSCPSGGFTAFQEVFAESLGLNISDLTPESLSEHLQETRIGVIGIDNLDRLSRPALGGQQDMDKLAALVREVQANVFWFLGMDWAAWQYISSVRVSDLFLDDVLILPPWTESQIKELVELRTSNAGIKTDFRELILPRQFEDISYETVEERNRFGFYRILWNASDGNPVVALKLWANSLRVASDGRILVSLPQLPATSELEDVHIIVLLTLRVIAQSGMANQAEIIASLRFPEAEIAGALRLAIDREWVELVNDDSYRITWKWFRSIMRVLARQNLLVRKTLGG